MAKQSGFLAKQAAIQAERNRRGQETMQQFMIDTLQLTLNRHREFGFGYDRLMKVAEEWKKTREEFYPALNPRDPLCDVAQEHMDREMARICRGKAEVIPFRERYEWLRECSYERRR